MTSSNGHIFRVTGPSVRGIHRSPVNSPHKGQWRGALMFFFYLRLNERLINNREAGDLRRHRAHYDVTVMKSLLLWRTHPIKKSMQLVCLWHNHQYKIHDFSIDGVFDGYLMFISETPQILKGKVCIKYLPQISPCLARHPKSYQGVGVASKIRRYNSSNFNSLRPRDAYMRQ